jgi:chitinase
MDKFLIYYTFQRLLNKKRVEGKQVSARSEAYGENILAGYWFEWQPSVKLSDIPPEYNVVVIAFMEGDNAGMPVYKPMMTPGDVIAEGVAKLRSEGRVVLVSLGGAHGDIRVNAIYKQQFKDAVSRAIETYGFSGIDIDLEGESVLAADNATVIPAALRELKTEYMVKNREFVITMAPEFIFLHGENAAYRPYIDGLEGFYDLIYPQYYNQGDYGVWSERLGVYLPQNDDRVKSEFLYTLSNAIVTGTSGYIKIPADKFAIGLPATPDAAIDGYVKNPDDARKAVQRLAAENNAIRGFMTWSINHDSVANYAFAKAYS